MKKDAKKFLASFVLQINIYVTFYVAGYTFQILHKSGIFTEYFLVSLVGGDIIAGTDLQISIAIVRDSGGIQLSLVFLGQFLHLGNLPCNIGRTALFGRLKCVIISIDEGLHSLDVGLVVTLRISGVLTVVIIGISQAVNRPAKGIGICSRQLVL